MQMADPLLAQGSRSNVPPRPPESQDESNERAKETEGSGAPEKEGVSAGEREPSRLSSITYDNHKKVKDTELKS